MVSAVVARLADKSSANTGEQQDEFFNMQPLWVGP
ncbi:hypothetical protein JOH52_006801 [Sinorhizobium meliloti]|nr:hypothetical protein [Sinorhizobium meliloti]